MRFADAVCAPTASPISRFSLSSCARGSQSGSIFAGGHGATASTGGGTSASSGGASRWCGSFAAAQAGVGVSAAGTQASDGVDRARKAPRLVGSWRGSVAAGVSAQVASTSSMCSAFRDDASQRAAAPAPSALRSYAARPSVVVRYTIKAQPSVVAVRVGSAAAPPPAPAPHGGAPQLAARIHGELREAAASIAAERPALDATALASRASAGVVTRQDEMQQRQLVEQAARLVSIMPLEAVAYACGPTCTVLSLAGMSASRLAHHVVERQTSVWRWSTVRDMHNVWARWLVWLERHDVEHDGFSFNAVDLGDFFEEADACARARAPANKARALERDAKAAAVAAARGEPAPPPSRWQDGSHALEGIESKMRTIRRHFGISLPLEQASTRRTGGSKARQPTPALTPGMVFRLQAFVCAVAAESGASVARRAHAAVAAGLLFTCFSINRCEQVNACFFERVHGGFLHGVLLLDKHPNPRKRQSRPFWMRVAGPGGSTVWFDFLTSVLDGVEEGCFVFRDFESSSGDPAEATRFLNNPLVGARLLHAIRCVLMRVCGISWECATRYALHSCRHFLMEVGGARGEPPLRAVELGRWSGSTAQDPDLTPAARLSRRHSLRAGVMPEAYAPLAKVQRVCAIVGDQMAALDALWARGGVGIFDGFEALAAWPAAASERD